MSWSERSCLGSDWTELREVLDLRLQSDQPSWATGGARVDDRIKQAGQFVQDAVQDSLSQRVRERSDDKHRRGFSTAVGIVFRQIDAQLDSFKEQMSRSGLSKTEQAVFVQLDRLKSEIETECDRYWRGTGVDWRPIKPVVKKGVVVRHREEEPDSDD